MNTHLQMAWEARAEARLASDEPERCRTPHSITAFFPAYHDAATIGGLVAFTDAILARVTDDYEILVVNDASPDDLTAVLDSLAGRFPRLKTITHHTNRGYGGALQSGFAHASKELIFYTDGDGQYDPTEILALLPHVEGADLVNGYKIRRADALYRVVIGRLYHWTAKLLFGLSIRDVDCDFRLVRRSMMERLHLVSMKGSICCELIKKLQREGCRIVEVPVHHYPRVSGRSQFFQFSKVVQSLGMLLRLWVALILMPALRPLRRRWLFQRRVPIDARGRE